MQKGFTLVEIVIALSIATVVGGLLLTIMVNSAGLFHKESSKVNIGLNTNDALSQVRRSIRQAYAVDTTSSENQLVLQIPSIDSSGDIIADTFDDFVFLSDSNQFILKVFPDPASSRPAQNQIFSTLVDDLTFKYYDSANPPEEVVPDTASKVSVTLKLKQKSGADYQTSIATTEANLRND